MPLGGGDPAPDDPAEDAADDAEAGFAVEVGFLSAAALAADIEVAAAPPLAGVFVIRAGLGVVWSTGLPDASRPAESAVAAGSAFGPEPVGCARLEDWAGLEG